MGVNICNCSQNTGNLPEDFSDLRVDNGVNSPVNGKVDVFNMETKNDNINYYAGNNVNNLLNQKLLAKNYEMNENGYENNINNNGYDDNNNKDFNHDGQGGAFVNSYGNQNQNEEPSFSTSMSCLSFTAGTRTIVSASETFSSQISFEDD